MKIERPINNNYCASVVKIKNIIPLENCDNVVATTIFGFQAIVSKSIKVGDIGIVFPAETQLSDEYCSFNNLYRHSNKNKIQTEKGYLEDNRRIRAVKFRGHRSEALFMPLTSLSFTKIKINELEEGMEFDRLNDKEICKKFEIIRYSRNGGNQVSPKKSRVEKKFLPEHYDTDNYFKWENTINPNKEIIVTQKLHGTSIRIAHTIVNRKLNLIERLLKFLKVSIQLTEYDYVYGSRRVIKDINNRDQIHYYEKDIWTEEGKKLQGLLPKGFIVYAELIGWSDSGSPIQVGYTYDIPNGKSELYVYRVAFVNPDGMLQDLSWDQVKDFCSERGLKPVVELWRGPKKDFDVKEYMDKRYADELVDIKKLVPLGENKDIVDEGVAIRVEEKLPRFFKAKSPKFLEHESKMLDEEVLDIEATQTI